MTLSIVDIIAFAAVFTVCIALSILFLSGRGGFLIAGYNTLSPEKKEKIDTPKLCKFMGKIMLFVSAGILLVGAGEIAGIDWLSISGVIVFVLSTVAALAWSYIHYWAPLRK